MSGGTRRTDDAPPHPRPRCGRGKALALVSTLVFAPERVFRSTLLLLPNRYAGPSLGHFLSETVVLFVRNTHDTLVEVTGLRCCNANMDSRPVIL